ncbi:hypothetical protein AA313_de0202205 [Arthrobotrys entomopaga]|nr:hypothetical protein AA313_de0202205 [Arthrobotrys entomopaga]
MEAKKFGENLISIVDVTNFGKDEDGENNWQTSRDWALLKFEPGRGGKNFIELQDLSLKFDSFGTISAGMIVAKKGRSTGLTFDGPFGGFTMVDNLNCPLVTEVFGWVGDSGSLVLDAKTLAVVGMIIAGLPTSDPPMTAVAPFTDIFRWMSEEVKRQGLEFDKTCLQI